MAVTIDSRDPHGINWDEEVTISEVVEILNAEFTKYPFTHKNHSCDCIGTDGNNGDGSYLLKHKDRTYATEQTEFDSLKLWKEVTEDYNSEFNLGIHSPKPYCHTEKEGIVMELINGPDYDPLDNIHNNGQLADHSDNDENELLIPSETEAKMVVNRIGQLAKIMENEGLYHGDIANRHILVNNKNYEIGVIDLEGISRADNKEQIDREREQLRDVAGYLADTKGYSREEVDSWFEEGYNSLDSRKISGALDRHGFSGFDEDYDFDKLGDSIEYVFN